MKRSHYTPNGIDDKHSRVYRFPPKSYGPRQRKIILKLSRSNHGSYPLVSIASEHQPKLTLMYNNWWKKFGYKQDGGLMPIGCVRIRL